MFDLQKIGCHNVNFVTPEHVVPQILEALVIAVDRGLRLPLVYNTSAYDSVESIQWMDGIVDIYMPNFKLWDAEHCRKYLVASDYADAARRVIAAMHAQFGELKVDEKVSHCAASSCVISLCPAFSMIRAKSCTGSPTNCRATPTSTLWINIIQRTKPNPAATRLRLRWPVFRKIRMLLRQIEAILEREISVEDWEKL
jgi:hypothetical protein